MPAPRPVSSQYFAERPTAGHRPGIVHVVLPDLHLALATDSGVFSPGRLDPGTRLLLETAPPPPAVGDLLDLGCGYGPLALVLAARAPGARVWAVDSNRRALGLCEQNAAAAGLPNVRALPPDDIDLPPSYQLIWSNPPIRIGKSALHTMLTSWLSRLARPANAATEVSSAAGPAAHLVVQRNLGSDSLQRWLEQAGWDVTRAAARAGYRVLRVTR
jgi:16S rRNA (guanine1207-N2)-methyltransferase